MKNYFTGFFTAIFLIVSSFILIGARSQFHQDIIALQRLVAVKKQHNFLTISISIQFDAVCSKGMTTPI